MNEIIPAILALEVSEYQKQLSQIEGSTKHVHVDIMDGIFVEQKSVNLSEIGQIKTTINRVAHLMVVDPISFFSKLSAYGFVGVVIHFETLNQQTKISGAIIKARENNLQISIALNPETTEDQLASYLDQVDALQVMTVNPGKVGQPVLTSVIDKIKRIHAKFPNVHIAVDGGIKEDNISNFYQAGARTFVIGSAIFNQEQPPVIQINRFNQIINKLLINQNGKN
ncbi:MAG: Ribulose-phosphate 3-epimerase [Berkelbacteria bacterium GW2011_GWA2_38_9]|uniref:Ribulose-phosphate 3-epimerase n=1 Tax=Berkelbacteria bacterium GW2011_GWA2_38_9 TaxID=1618334 RepID=A0A0G0LPF1_9BACT|nr:MAG: Ribulose-phosphate 3-epimerase [Berkelbacteria bacterium GW2011_GWA2_38_9]